MVDSIFVDYGADPRFYEPTSDVAAATIRKAASVGPKILPPGSAISGRTPPAWSSTICTKTSGRSATS